MNEFDGLTWSKSLPTKPGVYRMYEGEEIIYVGKAKNLQKRVASYFQKEQIGKTKVMVGKITHIEFSVVESEIDALVLESRIIRDEKPRYNIALKEGKGYPYIFISSHPIARIDLRYDKKEKGEYFGPFPGKGDTRKAISLIRSYCKIRSCTDSFYKNRTRPCLEYQIGRCTAPCVKYVKDNEYKKQVDTAREILQGKSGKIIERLMEKMEKKSQMLDFEGAGVIRDEIRSIAHIQSKISVSGASGTFDLIEYKESDGVLVIGLVFVRGGDVSFTKTFNFQIGEMEEVKERVEQFVMQYAKNEDIPRSDILYIPKDINVDILQEAMIKEKINLKIKQSGDKQKSIQKIASSTAKATHQTIINKEQSKALQIAQVRKLFNIDKIQRVEGFDVSHTGGDEVVGAMVVANERGERKNQYRRYNIKNIARGDDYGAMKQMLERRFNDKSIAPPTILMVDGGWGQIKVAKDILKNKNIHTILVGMVKGDKRKSENDRLIIDGGEIVNVNTHPFAMRFFQSIRDEAHRFAIQGHRAKRDKGIVKSALDDIPGIGKGKKRALLTYFKSVENIKMATKEDIMKVPGIGQSLARQIVDYFKINI